MATQDLGTPGTHGSTIDPNFNTDEYKPSNMKPKNSPLEQTPQLCKINPCLSFPTSFFRGEVYEEICGSCVCKSLAVVQTRCVGQE
ncbi:hypothetical protein AAHA92_15641 [Salvia divinorum]|uniref:Uncharacterized protein n=1 Tax=Salvia divinorum TaxID=28513 RepID=A0ABD1HFX1_SALDI